MQNQIYYLIAIVCVTFSPMALGDTAERQPLKVIPQLVSQRNCHGDDETFSVWLKLSVKYINQTKETLILDKQIGKAWYGVEVAKDLAALESEHYEYNPNIDWIAGDEVNPPNRERPGPGFVQLAPGQTFKKDMTVAVIGEYQTAKPIPGTVRPGHHILRLQISAWNRGDVATFEQSWQSFGHPVSGLLTTEPLDINVIGDPRTETECK